MTGRLIWTAIRLYCVLTPLFQIRHTLSRGIPKERTPILDIVNTVLHQRARRTMRFYCMICIISNKSPPSPTVPFKNTSGEISIKKPPGKRRKGHEQPATQPSGICSPPIKSSPRSPLKAARSRTEESTWAGQTLRRRPLGPRLSEDRQMRIHVVTRINIPPEKETGKT